MTTLVSVRRRVEIFYRHHDGMNTSDPRAGAAAAFDAKPSVKADDEGWRYSTLLAISAGAYALFRHVGSLPSGLGAAGGGTRWVDWIDLLTPYAVLVPAAMVLSPDAPLIDPAKALSRPTVG